MRGFVKVVTVLTWAVIRPHVGVCASVHCRRGQGHIRCCVTGRDGRTGERHAD